jgi:hypothetical protein
MPLTDKEIVEYQLIINSIKADEKIFALKRGIKEMSLEIKKFSTDMGVSINEAAAYMKKLNAEMLMTKQHLGRITQAQRLAITDNFNRRVDTAAKKLDQAGRSAAGFSAKINVLRVALGALSSMVVFWAVQKITETVKKSIDSVQQLEQSLFKLASAERVLSQAGIEVSMQDFLDIAKEISETFSFISDIDAQKMVAQIALLTKELKLGKDELEDLMRAIPILALRGGVSIESATQQVINGLTSSGKGWRDLGILVDAEIIKQEAVASGLVKTRDEYENLTAEQKQQVEVLALIGIANKSVADETENFGDMVGTVTASTKSMSAEWENFTQIMGQVLKPLLVVITTALTIFLQLLQSVFTVIGLGTLGVASAVTTMGLVIDDVLKGNIKSVQEAQEAWIKYRDEVAKSGLEKLFPTGVPDFELGTDLTGKLSFSLSDALGLDEFSSDIDTATEEMLELEDEVIDLSELDLDDLTDDLEKLARKAQEAKEEFEIAGDRAQEDFGIKRDRLNEDYALKREDILRDSNKKIADIQAKSRQKELNEEAKFQEKMRQLREKFLFSLEDALRERDARQVLRLQRQFQMDKQALINENDLRKKERREDAARQLKEAIDDRNERLRLLEEERQLKLARQKEDFDLKRQRAEEDHQRELADIARQADERLALFVEEAVEAGVISEEAAAMLLGTLTEFYGSGGLFDNLYSANTASMLTNAQNQLAGMASVISGAMTMQAAVASAAASVRANLASIGGSYGNGRIGGLREDAGNVVTPSSIYGGQIPISAFTPPSIPTSGFSGGSQGGDLRVMLELSPDLEARIVNESLNEISSTINTIARER